MQPGGHRFDPGQLHQNMSKRNKKEMAKVVGHFLQQYERKAYPNFDPNDRQYDRKIEEYIKRMKPEELDKILNGEDDDRLDKGSD